MSPVQTMIEMTKALPERDIALALRFIEKREFEPLRELVSSAITRIIRSTNLGTPRPEYQKLDLKQMRLLETEVNRYLEALGIDFEEEMPEDEDVDEGISEEYY